MPQPSENNSTIGFSTTQQNCLARALYDNIAESPDELAFRKGDILIVLEQNTGNIEGWWLCALRGRQGICPGNRLRLIAGVYEDTGQSREPSPTEGISDINTLQKQGKRRSWHVQPNKVLTPKKYNDVYLYDIPPRAVPISYDSPRNCSRCSPAPGCLSPTNTNRDSGESYDIPRPIHQQNQLTPSSSASSLTTADSLSSSNRSSVINMPDYDVPRSHPRVLQPLFQLYDVPPSNTQLRELPLELSYALDSLEKLQNDTTAAISKLLSFVCPNWRTKEKLESNMMDIKLSVLRLRTSLQDLAEFSEGTLGNASRATDKNLSAKLAPLVMSLRASDKVVQEAAEQLHFLDWSVDLLTHSENDLRNNKPDALEQLVACARSLTEDVRQTASYIQGNSTLLFKRASSPQSGNNNGEWLEDYDYVNLESKEATHKKHAEIRDALPTELRKGYDHLVKNVESAAMVNDKVLDPEDKQVLTFFAAQVITHHSHLTEAIDAFLQTVEHNQPPKVFLAHGKFVVLSAHKLVHIGDAVHRNVLQADTRTQALNCANALCEALATSVNKTKQAALQFPSVTAVQEMVDSVVDISHLAKDLKLCLVQAAQPI